MSPFEQEGRTKYRVAVTWKDGVRHFGPGVPPSNAFDLDETFRRWLLTKRTPPPRPTPLSLSVHGTQCARHFALVVLNAERASYSAPSFAPKIQRTRKTVRSIAPVFVHSLVQLLTMLRHWSSNSCWMASSTPSSARNEALAGCRSVPSELPTFSRTPSCTYAYRLCAHLFRFNTYSIHKPTLARPRIDPIEEVSWREIAHSFAHSLIRSFILAAPVESAPLLIIMAPRALMASLAVVLVAVLMGVPTVFAAYGVDISQADCRTSNQESTACIHVADRGHVCVAASVTSSQWKCLVDSYNETFVIIEAFDGGYQINKQSTRANVALTHTRA